MGRLLEDLFCKHVDLFACRAFLVCSTLLHLQSEDCGITIVREKLTEIKTIK